MVQSHRLAQVCIGCTLRIMQTDRESLLCSGSSMTAVIVIGQDLDSLGYSNIILSVAIGCTHAYLCTASLADKQQGLLVGRRSLQGRHSAGSAR